MNIVRRVIALFAILGVAIVADAASPSAAGGGGGGGSLQPGSYDISSTRASFNLLSGDGTQLNINVNQNTTVSRPRVGPSTATNETDVNITAVNPALAISASGCGVLTNPSDFSVGVDLSTASLHTVITDQTPTCGFGPNNFPNPLTVDVSWTGTGPLVTGRGMSSFSCLGYRQVSQTTGESNNATATASLPEVFGSPLTTSPAGLGLSDQAIHVSGTPQDACPGTGGGGKGAGPGPGPQAPGTYRSDQSGASFNLSPANPSQPGLNLLVSTVEATSQPLGGGAATTSQTDLFVSTGFAFSCFVIGAGDFTIARDLTNATLSTTLTADTPSCGVNGFNAFPLTIDLVWTGTGPIATTRHQGASTCLDFRTEGNGTDVLNNGATVTGSVTGFGDSVTGSGTLSSHDMTAHIKGIEQPACISRG